MASKTRARGESFTTSHQNYLFLLGAEGHRDKEKKKGSYLLCCRRGLRIDNPSSLIGGRKKRKNVRDDRLQTACYRSCQKERGEKRGKGGQIRAAASYVEDLYNPSR